TPSTPMQTIKLIQKETPLRPLFRAPSTVVVCVCVFFGVVGLGMVVVVGFVVFFVVVVVFVLVGGCWFVVVGVGCRGFWWLGVVGGGFVFVCCVWFGWVGVGFVGGVGGGWGFGVGSGGDCGWDRDVSAA
ncbi:hypothetical protein, partial [Pseudomonas syringae group genomosp. 7]|uniref:hypothetical protein n=1 Tax=Pseudomonas syringae group genomosp. 7 TaxID=251699 RepID=UPI0037701CB0